MIEPSSSGKVSAASIAARLRTLAQQRGMSVQAARDQFVREAFFRRLAKSPFADDFVLKGSVLMAAWFRTPHRPTLDTDFLLSRPMDGPTLGQTIATIAAIPDDDQVVFDIPALRLDPMQEALRHSGFRVRLPAALGVGALLFRADVGCSDVISPGPQRVRFDALLAPPISMLGSTMVTVIAEKYDAMVQLGIANTRAKDYFDLAFLARRQEVDGQELITALRATFANRGRPLPAGWDADLDRLGQDERQGNRWSTFLAEIGQADSSSLADTIAEIRCFLSSPLAHLRLDQPYPHRWRPANGWAPR